MGTTLTPMTGRYAQVYALVDQVKEIQTAFTTLAAAIPVAAVPDIAASTNITAVPGSFADLAAVQTYLAGANVIPNIEARLDALEAKVNAALAGLRTAGIVTP